jgi:competence protein ComEC
VLVEITAPRGPRNGYDERGYLRRHGIHVVLRAAHPRVIGTRGGVPGLVDRLRGHISRTMAPGLTGERRAIVAGVVLGEDEGLSAETADAFRTAGLYHLLAVSGQNVFVVGGGVLLLARLVGISSFAGQFGAIIAVLGYLAVLPTDVVNAAERGSVSDRAVWSARVVVVEPVWQGSCAVVV